MDNLLEIFPLSKLEAQTLDDISQPTFGLIDVIGGGGAKASVRLVPSSDLQSKSNTVTKGDKFKVTVKIETGATNISINEYRLVISFDTSKLSVIDQDSSTTGNQIKLLDTVFQVPDPVSDNNKTTQDGKIYLTAKTPSGNALQVNRDVAEIEFQSQNTGSTQIKIVQGTSGTQLVRQTGLGLSYNANELTVQIQTAEQTNNNNNQNNQNQNNQTGGNGQTGGGTGQEIPNTALNEELGLVISSAGGFLFLFLGVILLINKQRAAKDRGK